MGKIHFYGCVIFLCVCVHHISLSIHIPIGHLGYFHVICCCSIAQFSSVQFSHSVVSHSLPPHELQHTRPSCPSPTLRVYSNSCPLSWWCHPIISSSVVPFSFCLQFFPFVAMWMDLKNIMLSEVSQRVKNTVWYQLYVGSKNNTNNIYAKQTQIHR